MYRKSEDQYRQRDRRDEGLLKRIKNDVKSWFDDDDDDDLRESRYGGSYRAGDRTSYDYEGSEHERNQARRYRGVDESGDWYPGQDRGSRGRYEASFGEVDDDADESMRDRYRSERYGRYGSQRRRTPYVLYAEYWATPGPYAGVGPKGYQRSSNDLKERVCERLESAGDIDASTVEVDVEDGEVTLSGTVNDRRQKRLIEDCAESVYGVRDVHNHLRIERSASRTTGQAADPGGLSAQGAGAPGSSARGSSGTGTSR